MDRAITSASILSAEELPSHILRVNRLALRLLSHLCIHEIQALSLTLRSVQLTARAAVHSRRRLLYVCGGSDGRRPTAVGLRFDPGAELWEPLPEARQCRVQAVGAVVAGRFFLCGGSDGHAMLSSAECFNPAMRRWEAAPSMLQARCGASAVAVGGRLCVCGGRDSSGYLASCERFRPAPAEGVHEGRAAMEAFFRTSLGTAWRWRVALFCRGMVLDARDYVHEKAILRSQSFVVTATTVISVVTQGGIGALESVAGEAAAVEGSSSGSGFLGVAVRDVAADCWVLSRRRSSAGGSTWYEGSQQAEGTGNEETLRFSPAELAPYIGREVTVDLVDTFSGSWGWISARSATVSSVELVGEWEPLPPMLERRCYAVGAKLPGRLLMCGGLNHPARSLAAAEQLLGPQAGRWAPLAPMTEGRASAAGAALGPHLYVCGGSDGVKEISSVERFNAQGGHWEILSPMAQPRRFAAAVVHGGTLYVFGGFDGKRYLRDAERFSEARWQWEALTGAMPEPRAFSTAAVLEACD